GAAARKGAGPEGDTAEQQQSADRDDRHGARLGEPCGPIPPAEARPARIAAALLESLAPFGGLPGKLGPSEGLSVGGRGGGGRRGRFLGLLGPDRRGGLLRPGGGRAVRALPPKTGGFAQASGV